VCDQIIGLLDNGTLIQAEIDRRKEVARNTDPRRQRSETLRPICLRKFALTPHTSKVRAVCAKERTHGSARAVAGDRHPYRYSQRGPERALPTYSMHPHVMLIREGNKWVTALL
jgi:hypothetical protein